MDVNDSPTIINIDEVANQYTSYFWKAFPILPSQRLITENSCSQYLSQEFQNGRPKRPVVKSMVILYFRTEDTLTQ